jgi:hypothetical protein
VVAAGKTYSAVVKSFWESFRVDPRRPGNAQLRASDADREVVRTLLDEAYGDGRLTQQEFDERLTTLFAARTFGEIPPLVVDLVPADDQLAAAVALPAADLRARAEARWRREMRESFAGFLFPTVICLVVWLTTGGGFFWPAFPIAVTGLHLVRRALRRESIVEAEIRRLEKQEREQAEKEQVGHPTRESG